MQRNRLAMKARHDRAEEITDKLFSACARIVPQDTRPKETVEDFLKRGGEITKIQERR